MSNIPLTPLDDNNSVPQSPFEQIKRFDSDGNEYWSERVKKGRKIAPVSKHTGGINEPSRLPDRPDR